MFWLLGLGGLQTAGGQSAATVQWSGVERVIAFADVHGAYDELLAMLREAGVLDAQDRWAAGTAHLVSLGDLLDRGPDSRKVMDLLMRLQAEAQAVGGRLHVVLGNHEAMNLLGDLRYVDAREYAAFTDLEGAEERAAARNAWSARTCSGPCPEFDRQFPPGYFGHRAAFSPGGRYGQWLLSLPVAIRINDTLFVHAGTGEALRGMSLEELNLRYRTALADYLGLASRLSRANLLAAGDAYEDRPQLAAQRLADSLEGAPEPALADLVRQFGVAAAHPLLSESGPNWYRGEALCHEVTESDVLLPLLRQFGAARLVIGHTPTRDSRAVTRFDGRVVKLDTGMNRAVYRGRAAALFIDSAGLRVRYRGEPEASALQSEGLFVAPDGVEDSRILAALRDGEVAVAGSRGPDELDVTVNSDGKRIPAVFLARDTAAARREVAAFRLDRLLGLGLVPATAVRQVQGRSGVLQGRPQKWLTQADVQRQGLRGGGWCAVEPQFQLVYALDTLSGNEARTGSSILYDSDDWMVFATSFAQSFGASRSLPAYLRARPPAPGEELRRRLGTLDEAGLAAALGDLLDSRERQSILARRDVLLALPAAAGAQSP